MQFTGMLRLRLKPGSALFLTSQQANCARLCDYQRRNMRREWLTLQHSNVAARSEPDRTCMACAALSTPGHLTRPRSGTWYRIAAMVLRKAYPQDPANRGGKQRSNSARVGKNALNGRAGVAIGKEVAADQVL